MMHLKSKIKKLVLNSALVTCIAFSSHVAYAQSITCNNSSIEIGVTSSIDMKPLNISVSSLNKEIEQYVSTIYVGMGAADNDTSVIISSISFDYDKLGNKYPDLKGKTLTECMEIHPELWKDFFDNRILEYTWNAHGNTANFSRFENSNINGLMAKTSDGHVQILKHDYLASDSIFIKDNCLWSITVMAKDDKHIQNILSTVK